MMTRPFVSSPSLPGEPLRAERGEGRGGVLPRETRNSWQKHPTPTLPSLRFAGRGGGRIITLAALLALGGCGLQPVYSGGGSGPVAAALSDIVVAPIPDRAGYLVRSALAQRLGEPGATPHLRLEVELDDQIIGFGVRGDNSIARERRTLRARYRVVAVATGAVLLDATAGSDAGIDRVSSDYAVVAAETTALDRLAVEVARQIAARIGAVARAGRLYPAGPARPTP